MLDKHWVKSIFVIFFAQITFVGLFALFFYHQKDETAGLSVVLGGLIYCVPALLTNLFMNRASNTSAALVLVKVYLGTIYKVIVSICLFIYVFKNIPINIGFFLTTYALAFVTQYIKSYVLHTRN